jgi:hypothetical protein
MKDLTKKKQKIEKNPLQTKRRAKQKNFTTFVFYSEKLIYYSQIKNTKNVKCES